MSVRAEAAPKTPSRRARASKRSAASPIANGEVAQGTRTKGDVRDTQENTLMQPADPPTTLNADYGLIYRSSPLDRIRLAKRGVSARDAKSLLAALAIPSGALHEALHLSVSTLNRRAKTSERLPIDESERVLGLARLIGQVEVMVAESGEADGFDVRDWTARWLVEPTGALGGMRPMDLMDTMEGQAMVSDTLARMQSGAYA